MEPIVKYINKDPYVVKREPTIGDYPYHIISVIKIALPGEYKTQCCNSYIQQVVSAKMISKCILCDQVVFAEGLCGGECSGWDKIKNEIQV